MSENIKSLNAFVMCVQAGSSDTKEHIQKLAEDYATMSLTWGVELGAVLPHVTLTVVHMDLLRWDQVATVGYTSAQDNKLVFVICKRGASYADAARRRYVSLPR